MIPFAGDEITETILHKYLVDFKTAETIKIKASGKSKTISYKDIMGVAHKVTPEEVDAQIKPTVENLAQKIAQKIIELNGDHATNAVFLVGGGGQLNHFTDMLAGFLNIPFDRVALRGKTVLDSVNFETGTKKSPELVTPLGICFSGLEGHKREFMQVFFNDEPVKVFDTNNLTVMDIAAFKGVNPKHLIARRGSDLTFTFNQLEKTIKGEVGEPAQISINNVSASLNDRVVMNDYITIIPAKKGKDAALSTKQLWDQLQELHIHINNSGYTFRPLLVLNDIIAALNYDLNSGDRITTLNPTLIEIINQYDMIYKGEKISINGVEMPIDTPINNNDIVHFVETLVSSKSNEATPITIHVIVNGQVVKMNHKKEYVFVDIFDHFTFDLSHPNGIVVCEINHQKANYMDPIQDGDVINVFWSDAH